MAEARWKRDGEAIAQAAEVSTPVIVAGGVKRAHDGNATSHVRRGMACGPQKVSGTKRTVCTRMVACQLHLAQLIPLLRLELSLSCHLLLLS